jgi:hypothetical protein
MANDDLITARLAEYRQRRRVELLREMVFSDSYSSQARGEEHDLLKAEEELRKRTQERRDKQQAAGDGVVLDTSSNSNQPGGALLGSGTTHIDAQVLLRMSHVPTGIVHLLNPAADPLVTFQVSFTGADYVRLRLSSWVEGYSAEAVDTVELLAGDDPFIVDQLPIFFREPVQDVNELTRANLRVRIDNLDQKIELERSYPIWLLARTTAYVGLEDPSTGKWRDLGRYLAAWITPNAPEIMALLRKAADLHPKHDFASYQVDAAGVEEQVKAIYGTLKAEGINYINSTLYSGVVPGEYKQRVRLPREALANKSANCLDGTILMASLLEAASLNPGIVLVPGHAFLAWETEEDSGEWDYLETTMIGAASFEEARDYARKFAQERKEAMKKSGDPYDFELLSLINLRVKDAITPME